MFAAVEPDAQASILSAEDSPFHRLFLAVADAVAAMSLHAVVISDVFECVHKIVEQVAGLNRLPPMSQL